MVVNEIKSLSKGAKLRLAEYRKRYYKMQKNKN